MKKKSIITMVAALALVGAIGVGSTLAYFTDSEDVSNVVTMGHVDITVYETDDYKETDDIIEITEEGLTFENVMPGDVLDKDPSVKVNAGSADAYIRVKMELVTAEDSKITADDLAVLRNAIIADVENSEEWYYNTTDKYFYYQKIMTTDSNPAVLFDTVTIPTSWKNNTAGQEFNIEITAEAIQADNFTPAKITVEGKEVITGWNGVTAETYTAPVVEETPAETPDAE